ncbi:hemoglobin [Agreia bicolorata]|uniref:Group 1 truncated hemoglobin n=1 Tax=Agreia bicolorata TaxID=110935 RepID=A0A1T4YL53_9MICO|nr:group 1 truncated hemoglobin [Agreia bicolorata]SKB02420.1 hemoglobin [Agreia bicolorata]
MTTSMYERLGGHETLKVAVAVFYTRVIADPLLAPYFTDIDLARLRAHQAAFLTVAMSGPDVFAGRSLEDAHAGLTITGEAFDAMIDHLDFALTDVGVDPGDVDELIARVRPFRELVVARSE